MKNYFVRRALLIIPTFIGITLVVFAVTRIVPGGPIERAIMQRMMPQEGRSGKASRQNSQPLNAEALAQLAAFYGFDKPWPIAYLEWMGSLLKGDMGRSTKYNDPVFQMIVSKFPISLRFGIISVILIYSICIPLGIKKAIKHRSLFDNISSVFIFIGYALPGYIIAIILLQFFAFSFPWFPSGGLYSRNYMDMNFFQKLVDNVWHMFLPMIAYVIGSFAVTTMVMKNNLMEKYGGGLY